MNTPPTVFKIRQSPRTNFLLRFIKRALTVLPHTLSNRSLKRQLRNRHRPIICIKNSKNIHQQTITAKILPPLHPSSRQLTIAYTLNYQYVSLQLLHIYCQGTPHRNPRGSNLRKQLAPSGKQPAGGDTPKECQLVFSVLL